MRRVIYEPPDPEAVRRYLVERVPEAEDLTVDVIKRSWPGMSRETWFVTTSSGDDRAVTRYVFRMDPPGGGFGLTTLGFEADVYEMLARTDVPTQPLLWREPAGNPWLRKEFFVRAWIDGTVEPAGIRDEGPEGHATRERVVKELVDKLALIHSLDWKALGFGEIANYVPATPADAATADIDWHLAHARKHGTEPYPLLTEALTTLRAKAPPAQRIVIRKENNGIGEEIWQGERIVAMADWETASLGAPELDLAVAAGTTFHLWGVEEALAYYEEVTGTSVDLEIFQFYAQLWSMRTIVGLQGGVPGFASGADLRLQVASLGLLTVGMQSMLARVAGF